jgi:hypothetical protein
MEKDMTWGPLPVLHMVVLPNKALKLVDGVDFCRFIPPKLKNELFAYVSGQGRPWSSDATNCIYVSIKKVRGERRTCMKRVHGNQVLWVARSRGNRLQFECKKENWNTSPEHMKLTFAVEEYARFSGIFYRILDDWRQDKGYPA